MASIKNIHVLIVEQNESVQKAIATALGKIGFTNVSATGDLLGAWKSIARQKVGLLICEAVVGDKFGIHLLKKIRSTQGVAKLPVLIMSSKKDPKIVAAHMKAGASEFLIKPFDAATLLTKLKNALSKPPTPPASSNEKKLLEQGYHCLDNYDADRALALFTQAARANPKCAEAYKGLAHACKIKKDMDQFSIFMNTAAKVFVANGDHAAAEKIFNELRMYDASAPNPFSAAASALRDKGDMKSAIALFRKAIGVEPDNAQNFFALSECLMKTGQLDDAKQRVTEALTIQDDFPDARKLYKGLTGEKWTSSDQSDAAAKKKQKEKEDEDKRGTVRFWVPDLLIEVVGHKDHFALTELSLNSLGLNPMDDTSFEIGQKAKIHILRLGEVGTKPEIKNLKGKVMRVEEETVGLELHDLTSEQESELLQIIEAAQERQKQKFKEENKEIKFEIDMMFM
ncbi:response regulator [Desulfovibrio ferrophilus]|uniref:Putative response regulator receiver protein n=1 Tax=Desulfovibrio ferrophilus TaxID=241368 RepID=A0A2Z6AWN5_9BACT|nr:response regulator [Desulfovibrio ferrophilus]BBD07603.1 putative response regulator receiver protein [Desulfovibrio ferrophilus]